MNNGKISVYVADTTVLQEEAAFTAAYNRVSAMRRAKADGFVFRKDKILSLAAELLLQKGLADRGITRYTVGFGQNGKPYLTDWECRKGTGTPERLHFNLSHSEEKVMCAISHEEVGCDVEKITDIDLEVARRFFFAAEYETIAAGQTTEARNRMFYRYWTLKESFMKATGLGMALPLDAFRIELSEGSVSVVHTVDENRYRFREYDWDDGYKYAVCGLTDCFSEAEIIDLRR